MGVGSAENVPNLAITEKDCFLTGGETVDTPFGSFFLRESFFPLYHRHGHGLLEEALAVNPQALAFLAGDIGLESLDVRNTLFLDTETTGLAGGTGTYAFLVGLGQFQRNGFWIRQYLMRDFHEELAMLHSLHETIENVASFITFNGKSFDLPLLETRFTLSRFPRFSSPFVHLDLLPSSRRLWKHSLQSCSLSSLEQHRLSFYRENDIPGAEIPGRYFEFLHTGRGELLEDILEHNILDILSMVTLLITLHNIASQKPQDVGCSQEALALGMLWDQKKGYQKASQYYRQGIQVAEEREHCARLRYKLAWNYKRLGRWRDARDVLEELVQDFDDPSAYIELAKLYEHRHKDFHKAYRAARRALALILSGQGQKNPLLLKAIEHRLNRLQRKGGPRPLNYRSESE